MWQSRRVVIDGRLAWAEHGALKNCNIDGYYPICVKMVSTV